MINLVIFQNKKNNWNSKKENKEFKKKEMKLIGFN